MSRFTNFKIESGENPFVLYVEMAAASVIAFELNYEKLDYHTALKDICMVAPHMMALDGDLAEAYDDAFRTKPKVEDVRAVREFLIKYKGRVPADLGEMFS